MNAAMPYLEKAGQTFENNYRPYMGWANPVNQLNEWDQGYKESPMQAIMRERAIGDVRNASAAGGYGGTPDDRLNQGSMGAFIDQQNLQNYRNNLFQGQGLGFQAAQAHSGDMGNLYATQGDLAYQNSENENQKKNDYWKAALGALSGAGTGFLMGGPMGALAGGIAGGAGGLSGGGNDKGASSWPDWGKFLKKHSDDGGFASKNESGNTGGQGFWHPENLSKYW